MKNRIIILSGLMLMAVFVFSCRQEEKNSVSIEKIQFEVDRKEMYVGERATVKLTVSPKEARETKKVEYSASKPGIVSINKEGSSNEGVVFEAIAAGSVVIMARVNGLVEYCDVKVEGDPEAPVPFISLTDNVVEIKIGTKRHVVASLQGGVPGDQSNFIFTCRDNAVSIDNANNTVVIEGMKTGSARITVSHPKAQYGVDILVFVLNEGELAKYITGENVVFMQLGNGPRNYNVRLVGLQESELGYCIYQVVEGTDVITVKGTGDSCTIESKKTGIAKVEVINQGVPYPFMFQVVVRSSEQTKYISLPANFMIIDNPGFYSIGASMVGDVPEDFPMRYEYKLNKEGIIEVDQTRGSFRIRGLKNGIVVMTISNRYSEFDAQALIVVQNMEGEAVNNSKYIRTSQNVIQMEAGKDAPDSVLKMELVGGTSADQNDFEWVVEDSSVIEVHAPGKVSYSRAQVNKLSYEAEAIISAKRVGTTRINISNRKSLNDVTVIVKVYPKGTFGGQALYITGPGLIRIQEGTSIELYTPIIGGNAQFLGNTNWSIPFADQPVATVNGSGLTGNINGKKSGVTKLTVSGENIAQNYEALIVVYKEGQEDKIQYAYTDSTHYRVTVGQNVKIPVRHPNIADDKFSLMAVNSNKNSIYHVVSQDVIIVNGLSEGGGELVVTTSPAECNNITLYISVEPAELIIDKPYSLIGANFAGTNEGSAVSYTVTMAGANAGKLNGIVYSLDDERVAKIKRSSGNTVEIEGAAKGQTVLRINHKESMNEKAVVIYVVEKGQAVEGKIIIGIEKTNYVMNINESLFLRLLTNAAETQKLGFKWKTSNADKVYVEDNYDTAVITAKEAGNVKITVYEKDNKHLIDLEIFITIKDKDTIMAEIGFPDSVILVKNENKVMKGNLSDGMKYLVNDINYTIETESIASIMPQGLEVIFKGLEAGQTFLTVTSSQYNYYKKILVICVNTAEELEKLYYFTVDRMMYRIKKNDEIKINLLFGENGFPEAEKALIEWGDKSNNKVVLITSPRGVSNTIVGKNEGQAVIQVKSALMTKPVEITVEVTEEVKGSEFYKFVYTPIHQFTRNKAELVPISIYYGNEFYSDYDIYKPGIKLDQGYSAIKVEVSDTSVAEAAMVGQNLRIATKNAGRATITLSHEMIKEDAKLLVVVYDGTPPPESSDLVIFIPKTHWLIPEGQFREVELQANSGSSGINSVVWNNRNQDLFSVDSANKAKAVVTAIKEGSGTITVEYGGKVIDTIYISVSAGSISTVSAATESIIIMSLADAAFGPYRTRVILGGNFSSMANWEAKDGSIIRIDPMDTYCNITPLKTGLTELTVRGYGYSRTILVKVVNTEAEKMSTKLMNLDQRYYKLKKGETIVLNPYYKVERPVTQISTSLAYDNKAVQCATGSGGAAITAKNIGIERIRFYNEGCENKSFEVEIEVDESVTGSFDEIRNLVYLTTEEPVIMIKPKETDYFTRIGVVGEYRGGEDDFKWTSNSNKVTVKPFGMYALLTAGSDEGEAEITVSNQFCAGLPLKIKVIIAGNVTLPNNGLPYLYTGKTVFTMQRGDPDLVIPLEVRGTSPVYYNYVELLVKGNAAAASFSNGNIIVKEIINGTTEIKVIYKGIEHTLDLYIVVQDQFKTGSAYLTTGQNYVIVNKFSTVLVTVNLANYTEPDSANFSWYSEDPSTAYVVGNGQVVQILGIKEGVAKVVVWHPVSYNTLDILVKVIPSGSGEKVCYLTTGDNVIETYVSSSQGQIGINKVGGTTTAIEASWTVDNPGIVNILGNNDICHYTPRKEGVAKITVTDKEAGSLSIVIIVRKRKPGDMYLYTDEPIVQITPNSSNNTLRVGLSDGEERDEANFKWEIYTQLPSSIDVAKQGGSVVSIYAMGSRCSVNGIYTGTARLKVTHPKSVEALFILIQVTNFQSMQFTQKSVDMEMNDMMFITLETPDYENYSGRVKYASSNPSVCTVYGSSKAVLVSSYMAGRAVVTAYIEDTGLLAEVDINVFAERDYEQPYIITPKTTYVCTPRELPFIISAQMYGVGVNETDWDTLMWEVKNDNDNIIEIYPQNAGDKKKSIGRSIQVMVQNRHYNEIKNCQIEISAPHLTKRIKTILLQVQEDSNAFSITKNNITLKSMEMAELDCNILGGSSRDYDEVVWMADMDSFDPTKEIVRIMGKGKKINLLGMADGVTQVTAMYRGMIRQCQVTVKSDIYIGIQYQNFLTFPGERKADKTLIEINYEVRPVSAFIQWMDTDTDFNNKIANISYTAAKDVHGTGTGEGTIMIDPLREGTFVIMGVSNQKTAKVNIIVKNDFRFTLDRYEIDETPYGVPKNRRGQNKIREDTTVSYIISPANAVIAPKSHSYIELKELGITMEVSPAERASEAMQGVGTIYFRCEKEINIDLELQLMQSDGVRPAGKDVVIRLKAMFDKGNGRLVPVYFPVNGYKTIQNSSYPAVPQLIGNIDSNMLTGVLYPYKGGQYIQSSNNITGSNSLTGTYQDVYSLTVGDGSNSYILLDRMNKNAMIDIGKIKYTPAYSLGKKNREIEVTQEINENGEMVIRIYGGDDFIIYDRFGSHYQLYCKLSSPNANVGNGYHRATPSVMDYYNAKNYATDTTTTYSNGNDQLTNGNIKYEKYSGIPMLDGSKGELTLIYDIAGNGDNKYWYLKNNPTYGYYYSDVLPYMPANGLPYITLKQNEHRSGFTFQQNYLAYKWQKIIAQDTTWWLFDNGHSNGNIMVETLAFGSLPSNDDYASGYNFYIFFEQNKLFFKNSTYVDLGHDGVTTFSNRPGKQLTYLRNFIYGNAYAWDSNKNPWFDSVNSGYPKSDSDKFNTGDRMTSITGLNSYKDDNVYVQIGKGAYNSRSDSYYYCHLSANSSGYYLADQSAYRFGFLFLQKDWSVLGYLDERGNNGSFGNNTVPLVNPIKERYDISKPGTVVDPNASSGEDKTITESKDYDKYPYRYFPLPTMLISDILSINECGIIEIPYKNVYGDNNKITIILRHVIAPTFTNRRSENGVTVPPEKLGVSWDDLVLRSSDEIFTDSDNRKINMNVQNKYAPFFGKYYIDKKY